MDVVKHQHTQPASLPLHFKTMPGPSPETDSPRRRPQSRYHSRALPGTPVHSDGIYQGQGYFPGKNLLERSRDPRRPVTSNPQMRPTVPQPLPILHTTASIPSRTEPQMGMCFISGKSVGLKRDQTPRKSITELRVSRSKSLGEVAYTPQSERHKRPVTAAAAIEKPLDVNAGVLSVILPIKIEVDNLLVAKPQDESWVRSYKRKILKLYTAILRDESQYLELLSKAVKIKGISFTSISLGSILLDATIASTDALKNFEKLQASGEFSRVVNSTMVSEALLAEVGVSGLEFTAYICPEDIKRCHKELISKRVHDALPKSIRGNMRSILMKGKSAPKPITKFVSRLDCAETITKIDSDFEQCIKSLDGRYSVLQESQEDFLMILKLVKPVDLDYFTCLGDVIKCHEFLSERPSIEKNVRSELLREYLGIINVLRLKVKEIGERTKTVQNHVIKYVDKRFVTEVMGLITLMEPQYEHPFQFSAMDCTDYSSALGVMDKGLFRDLINYIPWLLDQARELFAAVENLKSRLMLEDLCQ